LTKNHYLIICIEQLLKFAEVTNGVCVKKITSFTYLVAVDWNRQENVFSFGNVALQMGSWNSKVKFTRSRRSFQTVVSDALFANA
jgi:hypothetical protein